MAVLFNLYQWLLILIHHNIIIMIQYIGLDTSTYSDTIKPEKFEVTIDHMARESPTVCLLGINSFSFLVS